MSELKPCFCEPCAACFGNGHAFNDLIGRSTRCSICAGTGRVSRAGLQITPQAGEAEPVAWEQPDGPGMVQYAKMPPAPPSPVAPAWQPIETAPSKELVFAISEGDEIEMVLGETVSSAHYDDGEPLYLGWLPREALPPPPDSPGTTGGS